MYLTRTVTHMPNGQSYTEELRAPSRRLRCPVRLAGAVGLFAFGLLAGGGAVAAPASTTSSFGTSLDTVLASDLDPGAGEGTHTPTPLVSQVLQGDAAPHNPAPPTESQAPDRSETPPGTTEPAPQDPPPVSQAPAPPVASSSPSTSGSTSGRDVKVIPGRDATGAPGGSKPGQQPGGAEAQRSAPQEAGPQDDPEAEASRSAQAGKSASSSPSASAAATSTDGRPATAPVPPVSSAEQLTKDNAGSVSGGRQGDEVILYLPSSAVKPKEWVSVFTYPQAKGSGWLEVSGERSVVISISGMEAGSYKLAVVNSAGALLGWAQLEISEENQADEGSAFAPVVGASEPDNGMGSGDWLLLCAAGVLVAGAAGFVFLTRPRAVGGL